MARNTRNYWWQRPLAPSARRSLGLRVECLEQRELLDAGGAAVINSSDLGPAGRLVTGYYYDLLGREPQVAEVASWTNSAGANLNNAGVAQAFIGSAEYKTKLLRSDYQTFLGRDADPAGLASWLQKMQAGMTEQQILAAFVSSAEYFADHGGNGSAYIAGLYEDVLGRAADQPGLAYWTKQLETGLSRSVIANAFVHSGEGLTRQVVDAYQTILGRPADGAGLNYWVSALKAGRSLEQVQVGLASSVEYFTQQLSIDLPAAGVPERHAQASTSSGPWDTHFTIPPGSGNGVVDTGSGSSQSGIQNGIRADARGPKVSTFASSPQNIQVSHGKSVDFSEISLGVNPTNPLNLVVGTAVIIPGSTTSPLATYYSMDGGNTWHYVPIDAPLDGLTDRFAYRADAEVRFDATGRVYVAYVAASMGQFVLGGKNVVVVAHSTDGGKTYSVSDAVSEPVSTTSAFDDKEILATGRDPVNPSQQDVYVSWVRIGQDSNGFPVSTVMIAGSTDGGVTWSKPTQVNQLPHVLNQYASPSVGPNGEINLSFYDLETGEIVFATSPTFSNGTFNFGPNTTVTFVNDNFNKFSIPGQPNRGIGVIPKMVTDTSNGPFRGRIYIAYTDIPDNSTAPNFDVWVVSSSDHGQTWSTPTRINDDTGIESQFNVDIAVDPTTGGLTAEWRDARNDIFNARVNVFTATSSDGGVTFSPNVQVSNHFSIFSNSADPNEFLEYDGIAAYGGKAYYAWSDNSNDPNSNLAIFFQSLSTGLPPISSTSGSGTAKPPRVQLPPDMFDPNNTSDQATQFGILNAGSTTYANLSIGDKPPSFLPDNDWYEWTAGQSGTFTASITYSSFDGGDLHLRVFTLDSQNHLIQLGSSRMIGVTSQSVSVPVTAGEPLLVWIYGFNHSEATYQMTISLG